MKLNLKNPLLKAIVVALIATALGAVGLDIAKTDIEQAVDEGLPNFDTKSVSVEENINGLYSVVYVIDGDTAVIRKGEEEQKVRIVGIDTPETQFAPGGAECFADQATAEAKRLLAGKQVLLATDPTQDMADEYGRWLVNITLPTGEDFGKTMIVGGFAKEFTFKVSHQNQAMYRTAEAGAQAAGIGLWDCAE